MSSTTICELVSGLLFSLKIWWNLRSFHSTWQAAGFPQSEWLNRQREKLRWLFDLAEKAKHSHFHKTLLAIPNSVWEGTVQTWKYQKVRTIEYYLEPGYRSSPKSCKNLSSGITYCHCVPCRTETSVFHILSTQKFIELQLLEKYYVMVLGAKSPYEMWWVDL